MKGDRPGPPSLASGTETTTDDIRPFRGKLPAFPRSYTDLEFHYFFLQSLPIYCTKVVNLKNL